MRLICGTFEVYTAVFDIDLWNIIGRLNVELIESFFKSMFSCTAVSRPCHFFFSGGAGTIFPIALVGSTGAGAGAGAGVPHPNSDCICGPLLLRLEPFKHRAVC